MTDEERKKLCEALREPWRLCDDVDADLAALMTSAANEIERLTTEVESLKNTNGELLHELDLWRCGSRFYRPSPYPVP
jgi:hypothetical protein